MDPRIIPTVSLAKVIGIGLPKTGTTSLHLALQRLGFRSLHDVGQSRKLIASILREGILPDWYDQYDAWTDGPLYRIAERLLDLDTSVRFIITHRDRQSWINSRIVHVLYNRVCNRGRWRSINSRAWDREYTRVEELYARLRESPRVLEIDLTAGAGWEVLCPFLDCPIPQEPFPSANPGRRRLQQVLDAWR